MDVSDLARFSANVNSVTGIQRTVFDLLVSMRQSGHEFKLCSYDIFYRIYVEVEFSSLELASARKDRSPFMSDPGRRIVKTLISLVPKKIGRKKIAGAIDDWLRPVEPCKPAKFSSGDTIVCLGAFWDVPNYVDIVRTEIFASRMKFAIIVYDLIQIQYPNWFPRGHVEDWREKLHALISISDAVFVISEFTGQALTAYASERRIKIPKVTEIRLGDPMFSRALVEKYPASDGSVDSRLGSIDQRLDSKNYIMVVGSIDVRKNQRFLLPIWARLLKELGEQTPYLVIAGKPGIGSDGFFAALGSSAVLRNNVIVLRDLNDAQLSQLYRRTMFTVFPTLAEGWGYPVAESLAFNKVCIASKIDSIPEVGGDLCFYIDPNDMEAAYQLIKSFIVDRDQRERAEARIASEYKPTDWSVTAQTIFDTVR